MNSNAITFFRKYFFFYTVDVGKVRVKGCNAILSYVHHYMAKYELVEKIIYLSFTTAPVATNMVQSTKMAYGDALLVWYAPFLFMIVFLKLRLIVLFHVPKEIALFNCKTVLFTL